jgi:hypothetical protein
MNNPTVSLNYAPLGLSRNGAVPLSFVEEFDGLLMVDIDD